MPGPSWALAAGVARLPVSSVELQVSPPLHVDGGVPPCAGACDGLADVLQDPLARRQLVGDGNDHRPFAESLDDLGKRREERRPGGG